MTNNVDLSEIVCYDPIPMHVVTAWVSVFVPIVMAIRCAFIRDRNSDMAATAARRAFTAITIQFAFFAFCVTTRWLDDWMEWTITAGMRGIRLMLPEMYGMAILSLLWQLAIQMAVTLSSAWFIARRLHAAPRLWSPWFSALAIGLLGGAIAVTRTVLTHYTK
jgi:hypothetical protein